MPQMIVFQRPAGKDPADLRWYANGRPTRGQAPVDPDPEPEPGTGPARFTHSNYPWKLKSGESHFDNMPAGVPVVDASTYSSSDDLYVVLTQIENTLTTASYVRLDPKVYNINKFIQYGPNDYRGFANIKKRVMGLIGATRQYDAQGNITAETIIRIKPTAIRDSEPYNGVDLVTSVSAITATTGARPTVLYFSGTNQSTPGFFSGLTFQGQLQTPFTVLAAASQVYPKMNQTVPAPLSYYGMSLWGFPPNTRFQFLRFQGFGWTMTSAPPFEAGCVNSNRNNGLTVYRSEMDGRLAKEIDPAQPRASAGWMRNKELWLSIVDSWQHDTRTSGNATNTNTKDTNERYLEYNYQCEGIADKNDQYPKDGSAALVAGFNGHNIEGVLGRIISHDSYFNVTRGSHYAIAIPSSGTGGDYILPAPYPMLEVRRFRTDDTLYNGCTRVSTNKRPNSTTPEGQLAPLAKYINDNGVLSANDYIKVYMADDVTLKTPVFVKNFNATLHKPATHYVLTSFT